MANFAKLQSLFEQACELPRDEQAAFVDAACADDAELHAELTALLASDEQVKDHTARKAVGDISALLNEGRPDALVGAQVGRYTLVSLIGAGGMGSVYLAERHDGVVQQRVAIKFLGRDLLGDGFRQRFEIEREILAKLDHPSITRLIDAEQLPDGTPYYVMDYVEGQPITRYAFDQQLDINARLDLFVEVAKAVSHAHQALIVHRDIKPGNILVDTQGSPHLLDFGIAKPLAQLGAQTVSMTVTGQRFFSPQHAAPEQLLGGNITVGCDVYGLGCLLYELLSGEPAIPLTGLTASEAEKQILHQLPQAPSQRVAQGEKNDERASGFGASSVKAWSKSIMGELDSIVLTCLRKLPHERYRSVDDLIADVQAYRAGMPISASGGHGWYRTRKFIARHRWAVTAATLTAIALISSSVITALQSREAKIQRDAAQTALAQAEQQRDRAQHVTQFLIDAFAAANPGGELGKSVTAREILEHGAKKLETELEGQPELKAQLLATIAEAQIALSLTDEAISTSLRAISVVESMEAPSECFKPYAMFVSAHTQKRAFAPADEAALRMQACVRSDSQRLEAAVHVARRMARQGQTVEVVDFLASFLASRDWHEIDEGFEDWLYLREQLAMNLAALGRHEQAALVIDDLVASVGNKAKTTLGTEVRIYRTASIVFRTLGRREYAIKHANTAMSLSFDAYGDESYDALKSMQALANAYDASGQSDLALELRIRINNLGSRLFGKDAVATLPYHFNYANTLLRTGNVGDGIRVLSDLVAIAERHYKYTSRGLFVYRKALGNNLIKDGRCTKGRAVLESAVADFAHNPSAEKYKSFSNTKTRLNNLNC